MSSLTFLDTDQIERIFTEEVSRGGGAVTDCYNDGDRLFARSLLPFVEEVRKDDALQGGAAIKAAGGEIWVRPYVFRRVCSNGAIMAHALEFDDQAATPSSASEFDAEQELRARIAAACAREVFASSMRAVRSTLDLNFNFALNVLSLLSRMPPEIGQLVMQRLMETGELSRFGMMNAVTSVARDTTDPDQRWRLEELGGGVALETPSDWPTDELSATAAPEKMCVA